MYEVAFFTKMLDLGAPERVLEVGCGRGVGSRLVLKAFHPGRIDAIDIDPDMIKRADRQQRAIPSGRVFFDVGDAQQLPFDDASMDAVFNFGIIHHLEDWQKGINEIARVLRPGGAFYFEEIYPALYAGPILRHILDHPRENRFDGPEYRAALEAAGLHLLNGYRESRYAILAVAVKEG
jgi:ubiquinone/menaquinone biosynthesis C-methylase UbiE